MKGAMTQSSAKKTKNIRMHNTLVYMRQHWQLYLIFMLPALVLTIVFRYIPNGRRLDCVHGIQPNQRHPWKRVGGIRPLYSIPFIAGLYAVFDEYAEA